MRNAHFEMAKESCKDREANEKNILAIKKFFAKMLKASAHGFRLWH